jgi:signal transduction histidine kinase
VRRLSLHCLRITERGLSVTAHATPLSYVTRRSRYLRSTTLLNRVLVSAQTRSVLSRNFIAHTLRRRTINHMDDGAQDFVETGATRIDVIPTLLKVLCEITGMRVALYCRHPAPAPHPIESYISAPIILANGRYFGSLSALDPNPGKIGGPRTVSMFEQFAALIAVQLDNQRLHDQEHRALLDERAAGQLREQFIAILGHDLRNPLHAVHASSDMLERNLTDPAFLAIASRIKNNARRMSGLIDDVLDFARGRLGGGMAVELTEIENINAGLLTVVQELQDGQPDCQIIADIDVSCSVRCDLGRLQQIASNLLANALTHGLPSSAVKISAKADANDFVLEVWNAGEPIPPESLDKIFEPFWRHSVSASRNGLGLGLHICSQIVRAHQGRISVTSTREGGTQFTARLPLGTRACAGSANQRASLEAVAHIPF